MNNISQYGFRIESFGSCRFLADSSFYFTKPRAIDRFSEHDGIKPPVGKKAAGVWFFNSINDVTGTMGWKDFSKPKIITRINIEKLKCDGIVTDNAYGGKASIAISYYDPRLVPKADDDDTLVKILSVPDQLVDVWTGTNWLNKAQIGLLELDEIMRSAEVGAYSAPIPEMSTEAAIQITALVKPKEGWMFPPIPEGKLAWNKDIFASSQNPSDGKLLLFREAAKRRKHHEDEIKKTGKSFWEVYDLEAWVEHAQRLRRIGDVSLLHTELPTSAITPFMERMRESDLASSKGRMESRRSEAKAASTLDKR